MDNFFASDTAMNANGISKTVRRLERAEGYIELDLPQRALDELEAIQDPGPFQAAIALLRGEAFKVQKRYCEAVGALKEAVAMIPAPMNKRAWMALSECYRESGREELAEMADFIINKHRDSDETSVVRVAIVPLPTDAAALKQVVEDLLKNK
jgi:tetratricopeptide (TPR) repeat protein